MKRVKKIVKRFINSLPYVNRLATELLSYRQDCYVPPGHFYSPIISLTEVKQRKNQFFAETDGQLHGIDLNVQYQKRLLESIVSFYDVLPFKVHATKGHRYFFENKYFSYSDGVFLYGIVRHFEPARIIEVGSGFSSAAMVDLNELFFENRIDLTFIEPFPDNRLNKLLLDSDCFNLLQSFVQDVDLDCFKRLGKNDILFIDSSHVVKTGSEVNYLLFTVLPCLAPGVIIHFHDVSYPFEYPWEWIEEKRSWNESYFIRAFLMHNQHYEIIAFNSYVQKVYGDWLQTNLPLAMKDRGGSIWLVKK